MATAPSSSTFARGACMECRRLKTKCDRAVPCSPCVRRGCESICPSGLRARGSRNPSAEVEQLNRNIQNMTARIRQLEDALHAAQTQGSGENTPSPPSSGFAQLFDSSSPEFSVVARGSTQPNDHALAKRRVQILSMLPGENVAYELIEKWYMSYGWLVHPISRNRLVNSILKRVYSVPCTASNAEISALCSVFALAISGHLQPAGPWLSPAQFHELSMAALQLEDVLAETTVEAIEAMCLQSAYLYLASTTEDTNRAWNYLGMTIRMAFGIGLHRDPKSMGFDDEECRRRRRLFHELISLDVWKSMIIKNPPAIHDTLSTTEMPFDSADTLGCDPLFFHWKHTFCRDALLPIINEVVCCAAPANYTTVLKVDMQVRSCVIPAKFQYPDFQNAPMDTLLQSQQVFLMREVALIKLHKDFFLQAMEGSAEDLFKGYGGQSVTAVVESAIALLKQLRLISNECSRLIPRLNCPWEATIASLSYLAAVIRKVSTGAYANQIYIEFEMGCKLLSDHSEDTPRVAKLMPHVIELRRGVHETAPHLTDGLRKALTERKQLEQTARPSEPVISLEYPLGPRLPPLEVPSQGGASVGSGPALLGHNSFNTYEASLPDASIFNGGHFKPYLDPTATTTMPTSALHNQNIFSSADSKESKESLPFFSVQEPFDAVATGTDFEMNSHFVVPF